MIKSYLKVLWCGDCFIICRFCSCNYSILLWFIEFFVFLFYFYFCRQQQQYFAFCLSLIYFISKIIMWSFARFYYLFVSEKKYFDPAKVWIEILIVLTSLFLSLVELFYSCLLFLYASKEIATRMQVVNTTTLPFSLRQAQVALCTLKMLKC